MLDFTRLLPGPHCTMMLADLGADVIKIEDRASPDAMRVMPPHVGGMNVSFAWLNRGKRSVALDLRSAEGVQVARRLAATADVLVESSRPGRMARLGLDAASLAATCPRLVHCAISGFGHLSPLRTRAGHDIGYIARAGLAAALDPERAPRLPAVQLADFSGALQAVIAILAALIERERGGAARALDVSLTDAAMSMLAMTAAESLLAGATAAPGDGLLSGRAPAYRFYRCADDRYLAVGAIEPKFWEALCNALELSELCADGLRVDARGEAAAKRLEARFSERTRDAWVALLDDVDCCVEPVLDPFEALDSCQARERGLTVRVSVGGHPILQPAMGCGVGAEPPSRAAAPLGADTDAVLGELGLSLSEIARLRDQGAVG